MAILKHLQPLLPENYIHVVAATADSQRISFCSETYFFLSTLHL